MGGNAATGILRRSPATPLLCGFGSDGRWDMVDDSTGTGRFVGMTVLRGMQALLGLVYLEEDDDGKRKQ